MSDLAEEWFRRAYEHQMAGRLEEAIACYTRSIELGPTAEAHTFLGWTYSFKRQYDRAIAECRKAIEVDPAFGNPYNDIGAYLIEKGDLEEAITWLEQAITSKRYESYHYPYYNLGRVFLAKDMLNKARECFEKALEICPSYTLAGEALQKLRRKVM